MSSPVWEAICKRNCLLLKWNWLPIRNIVWWTNGSAEHGNVRASSRTKHHIAFLRLQLWSLCLLLNVVQNELLQKPPLNCLIIVMLLDRRLDRWRKAPTELFDKSWDKERNIVIDYSFLKGFVISREVCYWTEIVYGKDLVVIDHVRWRKNPASHNGDEW